MIDMRMRQQHGVDVGRPEGEGAVVERLQRLVALEHAAVDEDAFAVHLEQMARAGDGARGAAEAKPSD